MCVFCIFNSREAKMLPSSWSPPPSLSHTPVPLFFLNSILSFCGWHCCRSVWSSSQKDASCTFWPTTFWISKSGSLPSTTKLPASAMSGRREKVSRSLISECRHSSKIQPPHPCRWMRGSFVFGFPSLSLGGMLWLLSFLHGCCVPMASLFPFPLSLS